MSSWLDKVYSLFSLAVFVTVVACAVYAVNVISNTINETKKSLNKKGVNVSASGISVKTNGHMTREDYLDATQRKFIKAIQTSTISTADPEGLSPQNGSGHSSPSIKRSSTNGSTRSVDSTKKKTHMFGIRKSASKTSDHST